MRSNVPTAIKLKGWGLGLNGPAIKRRIFLWLPLLICNFLFNNVYCRLPIAVATTVIIATMTISPNLDIATHPKDKTSEANVDSDSILVVTGFLKVVYSILIFVVLKYRTEY